jgi:hypothetical protein
MAATDKVTAQVSFSVSGESDFNFDFEWKDIPLSLAVAIETVLIDALKKLNEADKARFGLDAKLKQLGI